MPPKDTKNETDPIVPIAPDATKAAAQVPVIDTAKLTGATQDPRGENRPGVQPDPLQPDIDPITNLRREQLDPATGTPLPNAAQPGGVLNPAPADVPIPADVGKPKGRMIKMRAKADIWPRIRPKDWPEDREYRVRAGEEVELPEEEAFDRAEAGTAERVDRRA